ncbi:unnamed protein product, partial [Prorocentrum cordatum]
LASLGPLPPPLGALWGGREGPADYQVVGVVDGHGGSGASDLIAAEVLGILGEHLEASLGDAVAALGAAFADLEERCLELEPPSGACVCLCVVSGDRVVVANVGDCRAVALSFDGEGCALSVDQRCGEGPEYARIVEAGGAVVGNAVEGLMPARTVGDADVKRLCPPRVILAEPEVRAWEGRGVVVLATDGVWDVVGSEEALELIPYKGRALRRECRDPGASCARSRARIGAGPPWPAGSHLFPKDIFAS